MGARSNYSIKNKLFTLNITNHFLMQNLPVIWHQIKRKSIDPRLNRCYNFLRTTFDSFFFSNNGLIFKHN